MPAIRARRVLGRPSGVTGAAAPSAPAGLALRPGVPSPGTLQLAIAAATLPAPASGCAEKPVLADDLLAMLRRCSRVPRLGCTADAPSSFSCTACFRLACSLAAARLCSLLLSPSLPELALSACIGEGSCSASSRQQRWQANTHAYRESTDGALYLQSAGGPHGSKLGGLPHSKVSLHVALTCTSASVCSAASVAAFPAFRFRRGLPLSVRS